MSAVTAGAAPVRLPQGLSSDPRTPCAEQAWLVHYVQVGQWLLALAAGQVWTAGALDQARALTAEQLPFERPDWVCGCDQVGDLWALFGLYDPIDDAVEGDELAVPDPTPAQVRSAAWDLLGEVAYDLDVRFGDLPGPGLDGDPDAVAVTQLAVLAATATAVLVEAEREAAAEAGEAGEGGGPAGRPAAVWTGGAPVLVGGLPSSGKSALTWALSVTAALDPGGVR